MDTRIEVGAGLVGQTAQHENSEQVSVQDVLSAAQGSSGAGSSLAHTSDPPQYPKIPCSQYTAHSTSTCITKHVGVHLVNKRRATVRDPLPTSEQ